MKRATDYRQKRTFIQKRMASFGYAFSGIIQGIKTQPNLWIHLIIAVLVVMAGFYFGLSASEWIYIILAIGLVISAELFNSAIESLTNLVSPGFNEKAGKVKDIAAGAVLISAIAAALIGLVIFLPRLW